MPARWNPVAMTVIFTSSSKRLVEHDAEVDLNIIILRSGANQRASFIHFVQAQLARASDVDEDASSALTPPSSSSAELIACSAA